ncbi:hypothetical protein [Alteribacter natronophilus]|uniref:hypothetical protein n=1 Tax=Alteribacter natronophilus TaxID=2583810 RepID=UPI00110E0B5A|nr:hypothetical protein [Alteribacter natronophilus]TMW70308.1 hypothetical protein FGB90_16670 [Alteribacter natronophilus]
MEYLFAAASIGYMVCFYFLFSEIMKPVASGKRGAEELSRAQGPFYLKAALMETPFILGVVLLFFFMDGRGTIDPVIPVVLIAAPAAMMKIWMFKLGGEAVRKSGADKKLRETAQLILVAGFALVTAVPIVSIVFLLILGDMASIR